MRFCMIIDQPASGAGDFYALFADPLQDGVNVWTEAVDRALKDEGRTQGSSVALALGHDDQLSISTTLLGH